MTRSGHDDGWTITARHQPVMGTHLDLQITAATETEARAAEAAAVAEATRLASVFTIFDPASELCAWRRGDLDDPGPELAALLALAARWHIDSSGAFNPMTGVVTERWRRAADEGIEPSDAELSDLAASIAAPRFAVTDVGVRRLGRCDDVDLNAIAKGHVVDLVARHLLAHHDVSRLVVNAGGDLVHRGAGSLRVAVEDPHRPYDNAPPLVRIGVTDAAVATSGWSRRWFDVAGVRRSRVIDPRSGRPVSHTASATVIAPDAATAEVVATTASVLPTSDTAAFLDRLRGNGTDTAALVIGSCGSTRSSGCWDDAVIAPPHEAHPSAPGAFARPLR